MKKLCMLLVIVFAVVIVSGQLLVFAGGQNTEQHEDREDSAERPGPGNDDAEEPNGDETEERDQERNPDDKPE